MYHATLTFPMAENEESFYEALEEAHAAVRKRFPKAVYSDLNNVNHYDVPRDEKLTLIWRNAKKRAGGNTTNLDLLPVCLKPTFRPN